MYSDFSAFIYAHPLTDTALAALPSRQALTHDPVPGQFYRDEAHPNRVFFAHCDAPPLGCITYSRLRQPRNGPAYTWEAANNRPNPSRTFFLLSTTP